MHEWWKNCESRRRRKTRSPLFKIPCCDFPKPGRHISASLTSRHEPRREPMKKWADDQLDGYAISTHFRLLGTFGMLDEELLRMDIGWQAQCNGQDWKEHWFIYSFGMHIAWCTWTGWNKEDEGEVRINGINKWKMRINVRRTEPKKYKRKEKRDKRKTGWLHQRKIMKKKTKNRTMINNTMSKTFIKATSQTNASFCMRANGFF